MKRWNGLHPAKNSCRGFRVHRRTENRTVRKGNPTGKPLPEGAMGIVVGSFLPDDDTALAKAETAATGSSRRTRKRRSEAGSVQLTAGN